MKKGLKKVVVLAMAGVMTIAPVMTANAAQWKDDAKGWWIENDDGSYLVNQWYQSPSSGLWYYMGPDGYMLTNTVTPDGCYVDANGVWVQNANPGTQQTVGAAKDVAAIQQVAEAYKDAYKNTSKVDSFVFCDIDGDGIPECIATNGEHWIVATHRGEKVTKYTPRETKQLFYVPGQNVFCEYHESYYNDLETKYFFKIDDNGKFEQIGWSRRWGGDYDIPSRNDTSKAIFDDYNNSFGQLVEISLEYDDTYRSIDAACAAYLAQ